jgi:T-complex protein 1 subunit delta
LRDATNDLSLHFLAKKGILVVKDIERDDVDFIARTIGAIPVAHIDNLTPDKLGAVDYIGEERLSDDTHILKINCANHKKDTVSILVRGSNGLVWIFFSLNLLSYSIF